jgi:hypothetical protein
MTTLNISMTSALHETISHPGAYAYAVYFNSASGALQSGTVVVSNGVVVNSGTASAGVTSVGLPGTYVGGKVYFIIQSFDPTSSSGIFSGSPGSAVVAGTITSQAQISWDTATANDFRYDSFEVTLTGGTSTGGDAGNLTEVNGLGIPMELTVPHDDSTPTQTRGYYYLDAVAGQGVLNPYYSGAN